MGVVAELRLRSGPQEALKWVALVLMALDHLAALLLDGGVATALRLAGRLAFPLFGALLAYNLVVRGVSPRRYLVVLAALALPAQVPFTLAFGPRGNVFVALFAGVLVVAAAQLAARRGFDWQGVGVLAGAVALVTIGGPLVDYGQAGMLLVPAWALWFAAPVAPVAALLLVELLALNWGTVGAVVPLLVPAVLTWAGSWRFELRRLPRWVAYAFYPGHLALLLLLAKV